MTLLGKKKLTMQTCEDLWRFYSKIRVVYRSISHSNFLFYNLMFDRNFEIGHVSIYLLHSLLKDSTGINTSVWHSTVALKRKITYLDKLLLPALQKGLFGHILTACLVSEWWANLAVYKYNGSAFCHEQLTGNQVFWEHHLAHWIQQSVKHR